MRFLAYLLLLAFCAPAGAAKVDYAASGVEPFVRIEVDGQLRGIEFRNGARIRGKITVSLDASDNGFEIGSHRIGNAQLIWDGETPDHILDVRGKKGSRVRPLLFRDFTIRGAKDSKPIAGAAIHSQWTVDLEKRNVHVNQVKGYGCIIRDAHDGSVIQCDFSKNWRGCLVQGTDPTPFVQLCNQFHWGASTVEQPGRPRNDKTKIPDGLEFPWYGEAVLLTLDGTENVVIDGDTKFHGSGKEQTAPSLVIKNSRAVQMAETVKFNFYARGNYIVFDKSNRVLVPTRVRPESDAEYWAAVTGDWGKEPKGEYLFNPLLRKPVGN